MVMSHPSDNLGNSSLSAARSWRLMRLRTTALLLTFWLMEIPMRVGGAPGGDVVKPVSLDGFLSTAPRSRPRAIALSLPWVRRVPNLYTASKSRRCFRRFSCGNTISRWAYCWKLGKSALTRH